MRSITISRHGGPDVLEVREAPDPEPAAGEVRVRVAAAGLNFAETMARKGLYPDAPKPPCVVGYEVAGRIDAVGPSVRDRQVGERVLALCYFGGHADVVCVPELQAAPIPDDMNFTAAAAIPVVYLTAYHMLFRVAQLRPGHRVLVHMAAGGVGIAALQLCRTVENVTVFGTASVRKHEFIRGQGCDHPIDYHTVDYADEVRRLTDGAGVDIVLDALGGKDWRKGMRLLRPAGHLVAFGFANASTGEKRQILPLLREFVQIPLFSPMGLMDRNQSVSGVNMGHMWNEVELLRSEIDAVLALAREGKVAPHVDRTFPFRQAAEAHRYMERGQNIGKIVLVPDAD